jgi:dienelactone hydrolase
VSETHPFVLAGPSGPLHGFVDLPRQAGPRPAVVLCHGFKGFMEWAFFPYLAALLAERGLTAVRFNVRGSGMLPGEDRVGDLAAFRADTHSRELADLLAVMEAAAGGGLAPGRIDPARLGLCGHSRGGGNAILAAARPEWRAGARPRHQVAAVVTWAAVATFDRYGPEQKAAWRRNGELPVVNSRTGQELAMGVELLDDLEANAAALDIESAASRLTAPWLIVHGDADETVSVDDAHRLERAARRAAEKGAGATELLVPGGTHTFGARHPFAGPTPQLIQAMNATQRWFRRYLAAG